MKDYCKEIKVPISYEMYETDLESSKSSKLSK